MAQNDSFTTSKYRLFCLLVIESDAVTNAMPASVKARSRAIPIAPTIQEMPKASGMR
jgi:hypothetical protein